MNMCLTSYESHLIYQCEPSHAYSRVTSLTCDSVMQNRSTNHVTRVTSSHTHVKHTQAPSLVAILVLLGSATLFSSLFLLNSKSSNVNHVTRHHYL